MLKDYGTGRTMTTRPATTVDDDCSRLLLLGKELLRRQDHRLRRRIVTTVELELEESRVAMVEIWSLLAASDSVSMPSPIESRPLSTIYEAPSELSSTAETSLMSTLSRLTPLLRALSSLRGWDSVSSGTYESSILAPSPTVGSIALQDALDVSGETSFLRPTESLYFRFRSRCYQRWSA
ncbi:hypothetical protein C8R45DRAFT_1101559 [Mycena sanguinolenta]|nr:hypothetical protein C8R45DRAFT_1101559 [Mycena sanguinolenta]